jgi:uncharacterized YigZ family protein
MFFMRGVRKLNIPDLTPSLSRLVPAREARHEIRVANSRFIAIVAPVMSPEDAKAFAGRIREEFPDATHHVTAFIIGHGNSVTTHCHDDGEPSGTAGRPVLAVLQGSGLGDAAVVVVRYYGGTKLGTGGLVRAYGDAVRSVLELLPRARKIATHTVLFEIPYTAFERVRRLIATHHGQLVDQEFGAEVTLTARLAVNEYDGFENALKDICSGSPKIEVLETNPSSLLPLNADHA